MGLDFGRPLILGKVCKQTETDTFVPAAPSAACQEGEQVHAQISFPTIEFYPLEIFRKTHW